MTRAVPATPASRSARLSSAERRRDIVAAVVELARDCSPEGITTQAIADHVGLTHGALFRHFPDKRAMWTAVFDWVEERLGAVVDEAFARRGDPLEVLERVFLAHVRFVASHPGVPRILFHELQRPADSDFHDRVRRTLRGYSKRLGLLLADAKRAGLLPGSLDEEAAAVLFIGTVQGLAVQSMLFRTGPGMESVARRLFPLLMDGFRGVRQ